MFYKTSNMAVSHDIFADKRWDIFRDSEGHINLEKFANMMNTILQRGVFEDSASYKASYDYTHALPGFKGYCDSVFQTCSTLAVRLNGSVSAERGSRFSLYKDIICLTLRENVTIYALYDIETKSLISPVTPAIEVVTVGNSYPYVLAATLPVNFEISPEEDATDPIVTMGGYPDISFLNNWPLDNLGQPMEYHGQVRVFKNSSLYVFFPKRVGKPRVGQRVEGVVLEHLGNRDSFEPSVSDVQDYILGKVQMSHKITNTAVYRSWPTPQLSVDSSLAKIFQSKDSEKRILARFEPSSEDIENIYGDGMVAWVIENTNKSTGNSSYHAFYTEV